MGGRNGGRQGGREGVIQLGICIHYSTTDVGVAMTTTVTHADMSCNEA